MIKIYNTLIILLMLFPLIGKAQDNYVGLKLTGIGIRVLDLRAVNRLLSEANYPKLTTVNYNIGIEGYLNLYKNHITTGFEHYFNPFEAYNQTGSVFTKYRGNVLKISYARYSFYLGKFEILPTVGLEVNTFRLDIEKHINNSPAFTNSLLFSNNQQSLKNLSGNLFLGSAINIELSDREVISLTVGYSIPLESTWYQNNAKLVDGPKINTSGLLANVSFIVRL